MSRKKLIKVTFNIAVVIALVAVLASVALAAPPLQSGDQENIEPGQRPETEETVGANQNTGANQGVNANQGAELNQDSLAQACAQTYVVQQGDSLSEIANRFYGDAQAFNTILQNTNNEAVNNGNFANISDPNVIAPGQTLCVGPVPGLAGAGTGAGTLTPQDNAVAGQMPELAEEEGWLIVENFTGGDVIFDLNQPEPISEWLGPDEEQIFVMSAGMHEYNGHHPAGEFGVAPGSVQIMPGQATTLTCLTTFQCEIIESRQQPGQGFQDQQQMQNQPQQSLPPGQPQPSQPQGQQMQQPTQQPNNNNNSQ